MIYASYRIRTSFALAILTSAILCTGSGLQATGENHSVCFDVNSAPSARAIACTQIINAFETSNKDRLSAYFNRGAANYLAGDFDNAIQDYSKVISGEPDNAAAFYERGLAYLKASQLRLAISDFNDAIRINPNYVSAYNNRGLAYAKANQKALSDFNIAIQLDPSYATALYNRSIIGLANADYDSAISDLKKAIQIQPYNQDLYNQL